MGSFIRDHMRPIETPHSIYEACKQIDGYPGEGTLLLASARVVAYHAVQYRQFYYEPLSTYDDLYTCARVKDLLREGYAPEWSLDGALVTFDIFESAYTAPRGRLPMPAPREPQRGVHAVYLTGGWDDFGESLQFVNSWGASWGDKGYGLLSREYLDQFMRDAILHRNARYGPTRFMWSRFSAALSAWDSKAAMRAWLMPNPRWQYRFRHRGRECRVINYETLSSSGAPVDVFELRDGRGIRFAWTFVQHVPIEHPRRSVITEFFVWPSYRRKGYGTILEGYARDAARRRHSTVMQAWFHAMDAQPRLRGAGRVFGEQHGYRWSWRTCKLPNLAAIGEKAV